MVGVKKGRTPWSIYDPNGEYVKRTNHEIGYRPVWIKDADGNELFFIGNASNFDHVMPTAQKILAAVNQKEPG